MKEIVVVSNFQRNRLIQLEESIQNVNGFEEMMAKTGCNVLFTGGVDDEIQIDKTMIKAMKGGILGIFRELRDEGLEDVAQEIIKINAQ